MKKCANLVGALFGRVFIGTHGNGYGETLSKASP
jgi:hypothetical protein